MVRGKNSSPSVIITSLSYRNNIHTRSGVLITFRGLKIYEHSQSRFHAWSSGTFFSVRSLRESDVDRLRDPRIGRTHGNPKNCCTMLRGLGCKIRIGRSSRTGILKRHRHFHDCESNLLWRCKGECAITRHVHRDRRRYRPSTLKAQEKAMLMKRVTLKSLHENKVP